MGEVKLNWGNTSTLHSISYKCGYCGNSLASNVGYHATSPSHGSFQGFIYICHYCDRPTFFDFNKYQYPGASYGNAVSNIPEDIGILYNEARNCVACNANTASVLCCRKLLMNIAVSKGANEGQKFIEYIEFLADKGFVPPDGKDWVDHIRKKGNEANHEIALMKREDAEELITFIEMILKFIYEFPSKIKLKPSSKTGS